MGFLAAVFNALPGLHDAPAEEAVLALADVADYADDPDASREVSSATGRVKAA